MLKILVADKNPSANSHCCEYLANDKNLDVISTNNGNSTISKYNEIHPNILVINSDFDDKSYTEIINALSSTSKERNNCNIILTVNPDTHRLELNFMSKIYKLFYSLDYSKIKIGIEQYYLDNVVFSEPTEKNLRILFYKMDLYNEHSGGPYLRYAIMQCYNDPELLNSLNSIYDLIAKEFNVSFNYVRPAIRNALRTVNRLRNKAGNKGVFKLFEFVDNITPKNFIEIITSYYLKQRK